MMKTINRLICYLLFLAANGVEAQASLPGLPWHPYSVDWYCSTIAGGETQCALILFGDDLYPNAAVTETGYAVYQILKGPTVGVGPVLATNVAILACSRIPPSYVQCIANDEVKLAPGLIAVTGYASGSSRLNIYSNTPGHLFDWDGDGRISFDKEGLMLLRYLLGFSATAVTQGIPLASGKTPLSVFAEVKSGVINGWFQFIDPVQAPTALREGKMFQRCLLGLRGAQMVAGMGAVDPVAASARCESVLAIQ